MYTVEFQVDCLFHLDLRSGLVTCDQGKDCDVISYISPRLSVVLNSNKLKHGEYVYVMMIVKAFSHD